MHRYHKAKERLIAREDYQPITFASKSELGRGDERRIIMELDHLLQKEDEVITKESLLKQREEAINTHIQKLHQKAASIRKNLISVPGKEIKDGDLDKVKDNKDKDADIDNDNNDGNIDNDNNDDIHNDKNVEIMEDTKKVLKICDDLLGELPPEVIDKFTKSEDFQLYKKVMDNIKT